MLEVDLALLSWKKVEKVRAEGKVLCAWAGACFML